MPVTQISAIELAKKSKISPDFLVTRPCGKVFLTNLRRLVQQLGSSALEIDFAGVEMMDSSFADEVFGTLTGELKTQPLSCCLLLAELDAAPYENLQMALLTRPLRQSGLRNCVVPVLATNGRVLLAGKCEDHIQTSFDLLLAKRTLTARQLADELELDIAAASTRLKGLFNLGLCIRHEQRIETGRLFEYEWPF